MLSCYQCDRQAHFYEKSGNRLFCAKEHHILYHEGWSSLLAFVNTQPSLKKRVVQHLGMKRAGDDGGGGENIVLTVTQLEDLPDELIVEILLFTFPHTGNYFAETLAAFRLRETSTRMKRLIECNLFDPVTVLRNHISDTITDAMLLLFRNVKKLYLRIGCHITSNSLSQMTGLELLQITGDNCGSLYPKLDYKCETIRALTNLRSLTLSETGMGNECLATLTNLVELNLYDEGKITDNGLAALSGLKKLTLGAYCSISGSAFRYLPQLENLSISYCFQFDIHYLPLLSKSLVAFDYDASLDDEIIGQMTTLKKLSLKNDNCVTDEGLKKLTNLTSLNLSDNTRITGQALSSMSQLTELNLINNKLITVEALEPSRKSIEVLMLGNSLISIASLFSFPSLRKVSIENYSPTEEEEELIELLYKEGVDVEWWS